MKKTINVLELEANYRPDEYKIHPGSYVEILATEEIMYLVPIPRKEAPPYEWD